MHICFRHGVKGDWRYGLGLIDTALKSVLCGWYQHKGEPGIRCHDICFNAPRGPDPLWGLAPCEAFAGIADANEGTKSALARIQALTFHFVCMKS